MGHGVGAALLMRVVVALDSFKGSLDSRAAGEAVAAGIRAADPDASVIVAPVADGGEGTLETVGADGQWVQVDTVDALGRPLWAPYVLGPDGTAVVEAARTVGLAMVDRVDDSVPPCASSTGVGDQLAHALGATGGQVLLGLGGTLCTDGGTGLLRALGVDIRASGAGNPLWTFERLASPLPDLSRVRALADVTNPLLGEAGAAAVFAPQKGAMPAQVEHLERQMARLAGEFARVGRPVADSPGAGAAGGLGAALLACGAELVSGFDELANRARLPDLMVGADLVITGEGSLDRQTATGKAPAGIARLGRAAGAIVVGLGGRVERPGSALFDAILPIHSELRSLSEALDGDTTAMELAATSYELVRLLQRTARR
jgi:glycerate kinase